MRSAFDRAVFFFNCFDRIVLQGLDHLCDEPFGMQVDNPGVRIPFQRDIADGVHQMGFA